MGIIHQAPVRHSFVALTVNLAGRVRLVTENGRAYYVAPVTMIVPGVLNGSKGALAYYPRDIALSVNAWNGVMLTVNHPFEPMTGAHLSAKDPGVWDRQGIGEVRNARQDGQGKLKAEGWFDVERTRRVDKRVLNALESGEPIELSTGLYTTNIPAPPGATLNGRPYEYVARDYRPDHLAILPDQVGACSRNDGCGVLVNSNPEGHNQYTSGGGSGKSLSEKKSEKAEAKSQKASITGSAEHHKEAMQAHRDAADTHEHQGNKAQTGYHRGKEGEHKAAWKEAHQATAHLNANADSITSAIAKVAKRLNDGMGYGGAWWNPTSKTVWVSVGDWDEEPERYDILKKINGVKKVRVEAEASPKEGDGEWIACNTSGTGATKLAPGSAPTKPDKPIKVTAPKAGSVQAAQDVDEYKTAISTPAVSKTGVASTPEPTNNPAVSEAQRRFLNVTKGHDWVKAHDFDNKGELPETVGNSNPEGHNQYTGGASGPESARQGKSKTMSLTLDKHEREIHSLAKGHGHSEEKAVEFATRARATAKDAYQGELDQGGGHINAGYVAKHSLNGIRDEIRGGTENMAIDPDLAALAHKWAQVTVNQLLETNAANGQSRHLESGQYLPTKGSSQTQVHGMAVKGSKPGDTPNFLEGDDEGELPPNRSGTRVDRLYPEDGDNIDEADEPDDHTNAAIEEGADDMETGGAGGKKVDKGKTENRRFIIVEGGIYQRVGNAKDALGHGSDGRGEGGGDAHQAKQQKLEAVRRSSIARQRDNDVSAHQEAAAAHHAVVSHPGASRMSRSDSAKSAEYHEKRVKELTGNAAQEQDETDETDEGSNDASEGGDEEGTENAEAPSGAPVIGPPSPPPATQPVSSTPPQNQPVPSNLPPSSNMKATCNDCGGMTGNSKGKCLQCGGTMNAQLTAADEDQLVPTGTEPMGPSASMIDTGPTIHASRCPECGGKMVDGECEDCGYEEETRNSNPEGHNQYTAGGGSDKGKELSNKAILASRTASTKGGGHQKNARYQAERVGRLLSGDESARMPGIETGSKVELSKDIAAGHTHAADAHREAARTAKQKGDTEGASKHILAAQAHREAAEHHRGTTENAMPFPPQQDPAGPPSFPPAHGATTDAFAASARAGPIKPRGPVMGAHAASHAGDPDQAAESHQAAAEDHEGQATDARKEGDFAGADAHDNAAALHRKAASMHAATTNTVLNDSGGFKSDEERKAAFATMADSGGASGKAAGASTAAHEKSDSANRGSRASGHEKAAELHRTAAKAHFEASKETNVKAAKEHHATAAKEHNATAKAHEEKAKTATRNENMPPLTLEQRDRLADRITINCGGSDADKGALHALSDAALKRLARNAKAEGSNADTIGDSEEMDAGDDDNQTADPNYREKTDTPGQSGVTVKKGTQVKNFSQLLATHGSEEDKAAWNHALSIVHREKQQIVAGLTANIADPRMKGKLVNNLMGKSLDELRELAVLSPPRVSNRLETMQPAPVANYLGAASPLYPPTTNAGPEEEGLPLPVMNWGAKDGVGDDD